MAPETDRVTWYHPGRSVVNQFLSGLPRFGNRRIIGGIPQAAIGGGVPFVVLQVCLE